MGQSSKQIRMGQEYVKMVIEKQINNHKIYKNSQCTKCGEFMKELRYLDNDVWCRDCYKDRI
jgi:formylmethanofuran dehydrogenase subunit E